MFRNNYMKQDPVFYIPQASAARASPFRSCAYARDSVSCQPNPTTEQRSALGYAHMITHDICDQSVHMTTINQSVHMTTINQSVHMTTIDQSVHMTTINQSVHMTTILHTGGESHKRHSPLCPDLQVFR